MVVCDTIGKKFEMEPLEDDDCPRTLFGFSVLLYEQIKISCALGFISYMPLNDTERLVFKF
mgnify:CR=1 FL=1